EERHRGADGQYGWFLARGVPLRDVDGRIIRWYGTNTDIADRKRAEEALRASEDRFRLAAQAGKMFAYEWDIASDAIVRSEESANILGIDQKVRATGQELLAKVHPEDRERLVAAVAELS